VKPSLQLKLTLPQQMLDRIERAKRAESLSRTEAIRKILEVGLAHVEAPK
jgi:metal-responsive CopG/Arc/MetJ family transcriptional regulator